MSTSRSEKTRAIILMITACICFTFMNVCVRLSGDLPSVEKTFFRNLITFLIAAVSIVKKREPLNIRRTNIVPAILRTVVGTISIFCGFYAVDHLPIADASILNSLSPFFALFFSALILRERILPRHILCVALAFVGTLFVVRPSGNLAGSLNSLIGAMAGLTSALAYTCVRWANQKGLSGPVIVCFFAGGSCLITLPFMLSAYAHISARQLFFLLLTGFFAAMAQLAVTAAYTKAPARDISIYSYTQMLFTMFVGMLLFQEFPSILSLVGYAIIIGASVLLFFLNRRADAVESAV